MGRAAVVGACFLLHVNSSLQPAEVIQTLQNLRGPRAIQSVKVSSEYIMSLCGGPGGGSPKIFEKNKVKTPKNRFSSCQFLNFLSQISKVVGGTILKGPFPQRTASKINTGKCVHLAIFTMLHSFTMLS